MKLIDLLKFCRIKFPHCLNFKFQEVYRYVYAQSNKSRKAYLTRTNYQSSHRAIDDAINEAELLYYLIKEKDYPLSYQTKIID